MEQHKEEKRSTESHPLFLDNITESNVFVFDNSTTNPTHEIYSSSCGAVLCLEGTASFRVNDKQYEIKKNDLILCVPHMFVQNVMVHLDCRFIGLGMSPAYFENIFTMTSKTYEANLIIKENPLIHLDEAEAQGFQLGFMLIKQKLQCDKLPHHNQVMKLLMQSLSMDFFDVLVPKLNLDLSANSYSSSVNIFKRFVNLVSESSPYRHEVNYYANKLCITPKYLSAICKKESGKTASDIINSYTIEYIKQQLSTSTMSIKEIAATTGFDNLSFFGKYVKRELGMSPREYRFNNLA